MPPMDVNLSGPSQQQNRKLLYMVLVGHLNTLSKKILGPSLVFLLRPKLIRGILPGILHSNLNESIRTKMDGYHQVSFTMDFFLRVGIRMRYAGFLI